MLFFDFLLTSVANTDRYKNTHSVLAVIHAFGGIWRLYLCDAVHSLIILTNPCYFVKVVMLCDTIL